MELIEVRPQRSRYVALLRGINVGGKNIIKMTELRDCFASLGFGDIATYIQSGNVLFGVSEQSRAGLSTRIEAALSQRFGYASRVVLVEREHMRRIVVEAPAGFGTQPDLYRYDVLFVREPLTAADAMKQIPARDGVDHVAAGAGVCYFSRLISRLSQSYLTRIVGTPVYQNLTIRNWNTTIKLLALLDATGF